MCSFKQCSLESGRKNAQIVGRFDKFDKSAKMLLVTQ